MADEERKIESGVEADVEAHVFDPLGPSAEDRPTTLAEADETAIEAHRLHGLEREPERGDDS